VWATGTWSWWLNRWSSNQTFLLLLFAHQATVAWPMGRCSQMKAANQGLSFFFLPSRSTSLRGDVTDAWEEKESFRGSSDSIRPGPLGFASHTFLNQNGFQEERHALPPRQGPNCTRLYEQQGSKSRLVCSHRCFWRASNPTESVWGCWAKETRVYLGHGTGCDSSC
jgi:hypothetical protein